MSQLGNIDLVIFDCDGVLINSEPIASASIARMLNDAGVAITAAEAHERFTGHAISVIRDMCASDYGLTDLDTLLQLRNERLYAEFAHSLAAMAGISEVVRSLSCQKCVASNSTATRLRKSLGCLDLWEDFHPLIFSADMVERPKPAPDLFLFSAARCGVRPERCVVIDDSPQGITGAVSAGMLAIGFVDPADSRSGRAQLLAETGAFAVANGAAELPPLLGVVDAHMARWRTPSATE